MAVRENYNYIAEDSIDGAARELTEAAELKGCKPFHLAERKIHECHPNDETCSRFWRSVWIRLVSAEYGC